MEQNNLVFFVENSWWTVGCVGVLCSSGSCFCFFVFVLNACKATLASWS